MCVSTIGKVLTVDAERADVVLDVDGRRENASLVVLEVQGVAVSVGDWVLLHTGFAVEVLDPEEAMGLVAEQRAARASASTAVHHRPVRVPGEESS